MCRVIPYKTFWVGEEIYLDQQHYEYWYKEQPTPSERFTTVDSYRTMWAMPYGLRIDKAYFYNGGRMFTSSEEEVDVGKLDLLDWICDPRAIVSGPDIENFLLCEGYLGDMKIELRQPGRQTLYAHSSHPEQILKMGR